MASIQERAGKDGTKKYKAVIRRKNQPTQTATFSSKTAAKAWARKIESEIDQGKHFKTSLAQEKTLADLINRYIETDLQQNKPNTIRDQIGQLKYWAENYGHYKLSQFTTPVILEARDKMVAMKKIDSKTGETIAKYKSASINRYMSPLSAALSSGQKWEWIETHPIQGKFDKLRENNQRVRYLNEKERTRLLAVLKGRADKRLYQIVLIALNTGMRKSEIRNLKWKDIDFESSRIILKTTKNKESRTYPITPSIAKILDQIARTPNKNGYLFPSDTGETPYDFTKPWETALANADIEDFRFHDLRHTAASYLVMNGASIVHVQKILGHKTLDMVKRYAHLSDDHVSETLISMSGKYLSDE